MGRKSKKIKTFIGLILFILSISAIFVWELYGRQQIYYEEAIVLKNDIVAGQIIELENLAISSLDKNAILPSAIKDASKIIGMEASSYMPKGGQVLEEYVVNPEYSLKKGEKIMKLPDEWLISFPETLRRRDKIYIYAIDSSDSDSKRYYVLTSIVAYVKDNNNKEVLDVGSNRFQGTSDVSDIEIIIRDKEFDKMQTYISEGYKLIIMYE